VTQKTKKRLSKSEPIIRIDSGTQQMLYPIKVQLDPKSVVQAQSYLAEIISKPQKKEKTTKKEPKVIKKQKKNINTAGASGLANAKKRVTKIPKRQKILGNVRSSDFSEPRLLYSHEQIQIKSISTLLTEDSWDKADMWQDKYEKSRVKIVRSGDISIRIPSKRNGSSPSPTKVNLDERTSAKLATVLVEKDKIVKGEGKRFKFLDEKAKHIAKTCDCFAKGLLCPGAKYNGGTISKDKSLSKPFVSQSSWFPPLGIDKAQFDSVESLMQGFKDDGVKLSIDDEQVIALKEQVATLTKCIDNLSAQGLQVKLHTEQYSKLSGFIDNSIQLMNGVSHDNEGKINIVHKHSLDTTSLLKYIPAFLMISYPCFRYYKTGDSHHLLQASLAFTTVTALVMKQDECVGYVERIISKLSQMTTFKTQSGPAENQETKLSFMQYIASLMIELFGSVFNINMVKMIQKTVITSFICNYDRMKNSLLAIADDVFNCFMCVIDFFREKIFGTKIHRQRLTGCEKLDQWDAETSKFLNDYNTGNVVLSLGTFRLFNRLMTDGRKLQFSLLREDKAKYGQYINSRLASLRSVERKFNALAMSKTGATADPVCVMMRGAPGVGKSNLLYPIAVDILPHIIDEELKTMYNVNHEGLIFLRQFANKYWDGYDDLKYITIFDDFDQSVDVAGNPDSEIMDFMKVGTKVPAHLHTAEMDDKATNYFNSEVILLNTNTKYFEFKSIKNTEALKRRITLCYDVVPAEGYRKTTGDPDHWSYRLDTSKVTSAVDLNAYQFVKVDLMTYKETGDVLNYQQVICEILEQHAANKMKHVSYLQRISEIKTDALSASEGVHNVTESLSEGDLCEIYKDNIKESDWHVDAIKYLSELDNKRPEAMLFMLKVSRAILIKERLPDKITFVRILHGIMRNGMTIQWLSNPMNFADMCDTVLEDDAIFVPTIVPKPRFQLSLKKLNRECLTNTMNMVKSTISECSPVLQVLACASLSYAMYQGYTQWSAPPKEDGPRFMFIPKDHPDDPGFLDTPSDDDDLDELEKAITVSANASEPFNPQAFICERRKARAKSKSKKKEKESDQTFSAESYGKHFTNSKAKKSFVPKPLKAAGGAFVTEGGINKNMKDIAEVIRTKSMYLMKIAGIQIGTIVFVTNRVAMMPLHFVSGIAADLERDPIITFTSYGSGHIQSVKSSIFLTWQRREQTSHDCAFVKFPVCNPHKDIRKFITGMDYLSNRPTFEIAILRPECAGLSYSTGGLFEAPTEVGDQQLGTTNVMETCVRTKMPSENGDCGSLYFVADKACQKPLLSMHVAGNEGGWALSTPLGMFDLNNDPFFDGNYLDPLDSDINDPKFHKGFVAQRGSSKGLDGFCIVDSIPVPMFSSKRSTIVPTALHGTWKDSTTMPVMMSDVKTDTGYEPRVYKSIRKYSKDKRFLDDSILDECVTEYLGTLNRMAPFHNVPLRRLLTFEEAVKGIPGLEYYDSIPRSTSAGFPDCQNIPPGYKGKEYWFGKDDEYDLTNERALALKQSVEDTIVECEKGHIPYFIFKDFPKDERKKFDDVMLKGKLRLVAGGPQVLTILFRKYFMCFCAHFHQCRLNNGSAVGINPFSVEWDQLKKIIGSRAKAILDTDFKGFDTCHSAQLMFKCLDIIQSFYGSREGSKDYVVRTSLFYVLVNSYHIIGEVIYQWNGSMPSGNPLTVIINTLCNLILSRYVYRVNYGPGSLDSFRYHVFAVAYGDDCLTGVSSHIQEDYNLFTLVGMYEDCGYTITDSSKGDEAAVKYKDITQVTFLKRMFRYCEEFSRYVAPLELDVILEIPFWRKGDNDEITQCTQNIENGFRELSLHGREIYDDWSTKMVESLRLNCQRDMMVPKYTSVLSETLNQLSYIYYN
jgi:hypothetical protein